MSHFGHEGSCQHRKLESIKNYGGQIIGEQCTTCLEVVAGYGECHGCKKVRRLTHVLAATEARYCSKDCRANELAAERKAKEEALAKKAELTKKAGK